MTTVGTSDEQILKEVLMRDICLEDGKAVKVYKKIAQLANLGRTFFVNTQELLDKKKEADAVMLQKYGAEMYGSLIKCDVNSLMDLSRLNESLLSEGVGKGTFKDFQAARNEVLKFGEEMDKEWKRQTKWEDVKRSLDAIKEVQGPSGEANAKAWAQLHKLLKSPNSPWAGGKLKKFVDRLEKGWQNFGGKVDVTATATTSAKGGSLSPDPTPCPQQAMRVDITTSFDENWYKHKFKSGLLNKMIFAIKTDARSHISPDAKYRDKMADHKYTADEMLPQDERKLDSIKWKMTNKVAKDFIAELLGWSRRKEKKVDEDGNEIPVHALKKDAGFGKTMADKALGNRGMLGRLKQKLFAGGQKSESISVAFQMADMNDGWKLVKDNSKDGGDGRNGEDAQDGSEQGGGTDGTGTGGTGGTGGAGEGEAASHGGSGGTSAGIKVVSGSGKEIGMSDKQMKDFLTLVQRVKNLEDQVYEGGSEEAGKKKAASESSVRSLVADMVDNALVRGRI